MRPGTKLKTEKEPQPRRRDWPPPGSVPHRVMRTSAAYVTIYESSERRLSFSDAIGARRALRGRCGAVHRLEAAPHDSVLPSPARLDDPFALTPCAPFAIV
jgi:hypothetical protein